MKMSNGDSTENVDNSGTNMTAAKLSKIIVLSLAFVACLLMIKPSYIYAKSVLAQVLLNKAWQESQQAVQSKIKHQPWAWAVSYPVAKLT